MGRPAARQSSSSWTVPGAPDLSALVAEALNRLASSDTTSAIIEDSIRRSGREAMPRGGRAILAFISGPLFDAIANTLGDDSAEAIIADLGPMLDRAIEYERSGLHRRNEDQLASIVRHDTDRPPASKPLVLVADDDPLARTAVERTLEREGYDVVTADNGDVALAQCLRHRPDLILTGHDMPGLTGLEVARLLRRTFGEKSPPVVLMSSIVVEVEPGLIAKHLDKPVTIRKLAALLKEVLPHQENDPVDDDGGPPTAR